MSGSLKAVWALIGTVSENVLKKLFNVVFKNMLYLVYKAPTFVGTTRGD